MRLAFDNPRAFAPFFDDPVVVEAKRAGRTVRTTVRACVLDQGLDDPLVETSAASDRRVIAVRVQTACLACLGAPAVGDVVAYNGARFAVERVELSHGAWEMRCRST